MGLLNPKVTGLYFNSKDNLIGVDPIKIFKSSWIQNLSVNESFYAGFTV